MRGWCWAAATFALLSAGFGAGVLAAQVPPKKPYCCCVGDGTGRLVCEPNKGECECGCPKKDGCKR